MDFSGRNYEFIKADKILVAEIRPVRIILKYQDELYHTTKWFTFKIWQEIRETLHYIVEKVEAGADAADMNIIKGKSIVVGYQINPKNECLCTCSTPLETCDIFNGKYSGYQLSPYLLRISVYPLKLDDSELELANTWVPKQNVLENIKQELSKALKGYGVRIPKDISDSKGFDLKNVTKGSKKNRKENDGRPSKLKARCIAVFGHDSEESIDSWQPLSKSESESFFSPVSLTDENSVCDHIINPNPKIDVKCENDSPGSPTLKQEESGSVNLDSSVEKEKHYKLRERKLHSPVLRSKHRNYPSGSIPKMTPVIKASKNLPQSRQIQNDRNSLSDFDLESKYFKKKTRKRKGSGTSNLTKDLDSSKLMDNLNNINRFSNTLNDNDVLGNSHSSLSAYSPSNVSNSSKVKKSKNTSKKLPSKKQSSKKPKLCIKENISSSFEKRQLRSSVSSDSMPEIPSIESKQSSTKTGKLNTKSKLKKTPVRRNRKTKKTEPSRTKESLLNELDVLLEEFSKRNGVSSPEKERSKSKRESIFSISSSPTQKGDSETYTEVSRSSYSRGRIASLEMKKSESEDCTKPKSYDKPFLDLIVIEFNKLTREDLRLVLRQNRSYLEGIIRGDIWNDRDQKFLGSPNVPRILTAQIFVTVYEDEFYETLAFMIEEELGSCMKNSNRDIPVIIYGLAVILPEIMKKTLLSFPFVRERGISTDEECEEIFYRIMLNSSSIDDEF